jgi:hypothetical protein
MQEFIQSNQTSNNKEELISLFKESNENQKKEESELNQLAGLKEDDNQSEQEILASLTLNVTNATVDSKPPSASLLQLDLENPRGSFGNILHMLTFGLFGKQQDRVGRKVEGHSKIISNSKQTLINNQYSHTEEYEEQHT